MNLDFILFTPPSIKRSLVDFWGQVIFIPVFKESDKKQQKEISFIDTLLNCYQPKKDSVVQLTVDRAYIQAYGLPQIDSDSLKTQDSNQSTARTKVSLAKLKDEKILKPIGYIQTKPIQQKIKQPKKYLHLERHIPCLFLNSMVGSKYLLIYFHASGQDIKLSQKLLDLIRNSYQMNVLAMEYPGYSIYPGKPCSQKIKTNAEHVLNYVVHNIGFEQQNIIVLGRSIGTGVAIQLCKNRKVGALGLISAFQSVKSLAKQFAGKIGHFIAQDTYNNKKAITDINSPIFFLHGRSDQLIHFGNSVNLRNLVKPEIKAFIQTPKTMSHSSFDYYGDLIDPLRNFLIEEIGMNFYQQNMKGPQVPSELFQFPQGWKHG